MMDSVCDDKNQTDNNHSYLLCQKNGNVSDDKNQNYYDVIAMIVDRISNHCRLDDGNEWDNWQHADDQNWT